MLHFYLVYVYVNVRENKKENIGFYSHIYKHTRTQTPFGDGDIHVKGTEIDSRLQFEKRD